jgi:hypothetical protein
MIARGSAVESLDATSLESVQTPPTPSLNPRSGVWPNRTGSHPLGLCNG